MAKIRDSRSTGRRDVGLSHDPRSNNLQPRSGGVSLFIRNIELIEAGEVGVLFQVKDGATATLQRIADEFNKIQLIVDKVTEAIDKIGGADSGLGKLQEALGLTAKAGEDASRTITEGFGKIDGAIDSSIQRVNALRTSFMEAAEAARVINVASSSIGGGGGGLPPLK
jgi:hypothetical protein